VYIIVVGNSAATHINMCVGAATHVNMCVGAATHVNMCVGAATHIKRDDTSSSVGPYAGLF